MSTGRKQPVEGRCADGKRRCQGTHPLICETHGCAILEGRAAAVECQKRADAEREAFAAARGYAALGKWIARTIREARRELRAHEEKGEAFLASFHDGRIAALIDLREMLAAQKTAPHTDGASRQNPHKPRA